IVADEVRKLAERTAAGTQRVAGIARASQEDTTSAVARMRAASAEIVDGARGVREVGGRLARVSEGSASVARRVETIVARAKDASNVRRRLAAAIDDLGRPLREEEAESPRLPAEDPACAGSGDEGLPQGEKDASRGGGR
ncbi:MAG: hypothetical protein JXP34_10070, partial [Planctomycetes bacterium]|nr:hypothetical protein [Planctomycetota bacterium]